MKRLVLVLALVAVAQAASGQAPPCRDASPPLTVPQESYAQIARDGSADRVWLYIYVPDIKSRFGQVGFKPFDMWLVEGVYGRAFADTSGPMKESEFAMIRRSPNVKARPIKVRFDDQTQSAARVSQSITVGKETLTIQVDAVTIGFFVADTVSVRICR